MDSLHLFGFAKLRDRAPQGAIPLFRSSPSANTAFIQNIDSKGRISSFSPVSVTPDLHVTPSESVPFSVGDEAVIAAEINDGRLIYGTENELAHDYEKEILDLFNNMEEVDHVLFLATISIVFYGIVPELKRVRALKLAADNLASRSQKTADTWRDAVAIPSLIKQVAAGKSDMPFYVISRPPSCTVYSTRNFPKNVLAEVSRQLAPFGIDTIDNRIWEAPARSDADSIRWLLFGEGGVARQVFERAPFDGRNAIPPGSERPISIAVIEPLSFEDEREHSTIAATKSDKRSVEGTASALKALKSASGSCHIFNVRPIGFGSVSPRMLSPFEIHSRLKSHGKVWASARHRLRRSASSFQDLRASNTASRVLKLASQCLIETEASESSDMAKVVNRLRNESSLGAVSSIKISNSEDLETNVARLFRSCASSEFDVESGKNFVVFWPGLSGRPNEISFEVLDIWHSALIVPSRQRNINSIIGFIDNILPASEQTFRRLCGLLMEDYNWRFRGDDGFRMFYENEGEGEILVPVSERSAFLETLSKHHDDTMKEVIITSFRLNDREFSFLKEGDVVVHFSDIGNWMHERFGVRQYEDW